MNWTYLHHSIIYVLVMTPARDVAGYRHEPKGSSAYKLQHLEWVAPTKRKHKRCSSSGRTGGYQMDQKQTGARKKVVSSVTEIRVN